MSNCIKSIKHIIDNIQKRVSWDEYFMSIALLVSQRSSCERLKVGCVIVKDNRILCTGYNGFLPGGPHISRVFNNHEQCTVHAEQNAISDAASRMVSVKNATAYISHYPCINCFKAVAAAHIKHIKYYSDYKNDKFVKILAEENNIKIEKIV